MDKRLSFFQRGRQASSQNYAIQDDTGGLGTSVSSGGSGPQGASRAGYGAGLIDDDKDWWTVDLP